MKIEKKVILVLLVVSTVATMGAIWFDGRSTEAMASIGTLWAAALAGAIFRRLSPRPDSAWMSWSNVFLFLTAACWIVAIWIKAEFHDWEDKVVRTSRCCLVLSAVLFVASAVVGDDTPPQPRSKTVPKKPAPANTATVSDEAAATGSDLKSD